MSPGRHELEPGLWLDWRRAVWLEQSRTLVVADLHLGYAWAQRGRGQLIPLGDASAERHRLLALLDSYPAEEVVVLGDVVHRAANIEGLVGEVSSFCDAVAGRCRLTLVAGNHDRFLPELLRQAGIHLPVRPEVRIASWRLIHGDRVSSGDVEPEALGEPAEVSLRVMMGHEHPAILLGDGVATSAKCPCFLVGREVLVLPAFSEWAAGTVVGRNPFLSPIATAARFQHAVAVMGQRLLRVPMRG